MQPNKMKLKRKETIQVIIAAIAVAFMPCALVADMRDDFRSPQGTARENAGPLFWLHGAEAETPERLREYVGKVAESGQGFLVIESRPHKEWMREGWWRDVDVILGECRKRGLKMMIFDDWWWPSQGMGGMFPIPLDFQCREVKSVVYDSRKTPKRVGNEIVRIRVREKEKDVFEPSPGGDKTIIYNWCVMDMAQSKDWFKCPLVNGLDEAAVDWFLETFLKPYCDRYEADFKSGLITGFFFDEPQTHGWWGPALEKELEARDEDIGVLLTALKYKLADPDAQAAALYRYLDARAEAWGRTMYGRQSDWCEKHGVYSSGHFREDNWGYYSKERCAGNVMQLMKYVTVPGVDLVSRDYYPEQRTDPNRLVKFGQVPKYAASAAHVYNLNEGLCWSEIFGAYKQHLTYPQMKWLCDEHMSRGCYRMIPHSFNPSAPFDTDCPPYFYNGGFEPRYPLFRVWVDYANRCAMLLSGTRHVCRIAQCVPGISYHVGATIRPEMFAFAIEDAQLDSDWLGYDAVETARMERNPHTGRMSLRTQNGDEHYDILSLPATECVPFAVLEKALAFAKAGGVVVGYGVKPCKTPTRGKSAADVKRVVDAIFAQPASLFLDGEPNGAQLRAALAKNYPGEGRPLAVREVEFVGLSDADARMLALYQCEKGGGNICFVANQDCARRRDVAVRAKWSAENVVLWDPMQGTVETPVVENGLVKLSLEPSQAVFLVWPAAGSGIHAASPALIPPRVEMPEGQVIPVGAKEAVTPMVAGGTNGPTALSLDGARWIWHPVNPRAEGKVTFRARIDAPEMQEATITFSCDNAAVVRVNGETVAEQKSGDAPRYDEWLMPTTATFTLKSGTNDIEVLAENALPGLAGFVAAIRWPAGVLLTKGDDWRVARSGEAFVKPFEVVDFGRGAWGRLEPPMRVTRSPFSESVATTCAFTLPEIKAGERVYFVCDGTEGEDSAAVTVNGAFAGGFIGAPFRLDITHFVKTGPNALETKPFRIKNPRIVVRNTF